MYKLSFYVPVKYAESVKSAVFLTGAGCVGDYENCCWQIQGEGQFKPTEGSQPFIGKKGVIEKVEEFKVEMVCKDELISLAVKALKEAHPYEEPAYEVIRLESY